MLSVITKRKFLRNLTRNKDLLDWVLIADANGLLVLSVTTEIRGALDRSNVGVLNFDDLCMVDRYKRMGM